jgi:hypothetical protein
MATPASDTTQMSPPSSKNVMGKVPSVSQDSARIVASGPKGNSAAEIATARTAMPADARITLGEGGDAVTRSVKEILDDIEAEQGLEQVLDACRIAGMRQ